MPKAGSIFLPLGTGRESAEVLPVHTDFTHEVPSRLGRSEEGQAIAEYACLLAAIIGLLALISGFGLTTTRVLTWIANNL